MMKKWVINYSYIKNPFSGVLCFALKNKHPLKCSALTYWQEVEPSRINLGKEKYGGPFLERDVESVKTFFRLLPLVAAMTMISFPFQALGRLASKSLSFEQCLLSGSYFIEYCVALVAVPIYQFVIKPYCFYQISMLKRVGIGIILTVVGKLGYIALDLYISIPAYSFHNETICLLNSGLNTTNTSDHDISIYLLLIPNCINSLGTLFIIPGSLEFVFAQAPHSMRGLLIGLWYGLGGLYEVAGWIMIQPFKALSEHLIPSCELYVLIMNFLVMLTCLILFLLLSRKYKLHGHEDVFNAHNIVECYYENEFNQRDLYNHYGSLSSSASDVQT